MRRYRSRPQYVEAVRFDGTTLGAQAIGRWVRKEPATEIAGADPVLSVPNSLIVIDIDTPRGMMRARPGDWVVRSVEAGFFTVIPDAAFRQTFEETL